MLLLVKGEGQLPQQLEALGARGEGGHLSLAPTTTSQMKEKVLAMPLSPVLLPTGSTLLCCPVEAQAHSILPSAAASEELSQVPPPPAGVKG